jgi:predicted nucleotidyltransferase
MIPNNKNYSEKERIKILVTPILKKYRIKRASFFGSFVKNTQKKTSDVDILVEFEKGRSLFDLVRLKRELEETILKKTDVLTYNSLHPLIKQNILDEQEIIYDERT